MTPYDCTQSFETIHLFLHNRVRILFKFIHFHFMFLFLELFILDIG